MGNFRHPREPGFSVSDSGAFYLSRFLPWTELRAEVMTSDIEWPQWHIVFFICRLSVGCEGQGALFRGFICKKPLVYIVAGGQMAED